MYSTHANKHKHAKIVMLSVLLCLFILGGAAVHHLITNYCCFTVISGSMEPALDTGCLIVVSKNTHSLYSKGDIITYKEENAFITHRITEMEFDGEFYYSTKGDANKKKDKQWVAHQEVVGRVVFATPAVVTPVLVFLRSLSLMAVMQVSAIIILLVFTARHIRTKKRPIRKSTHNWT